MEGIVARRNEGIGGSRCKIVGGVGGVAELEGFLCKNR